MTTIADDPAASLIDPSKTMAAAVSYLRVSTREQAEKGGTDEGFSIPADRAAAVSTSTTISTVSRPVKVFCWLTW